MNMSFWSHCQGLFLRLQQRSSGSRPWLRHRAMGSLPKPFVLIVALVAIGYAIMDPGAIPVVNTIAKIEQHRNDDGSLNSESHFDRFGNLRIVRHFHPNGQMLGDAHLDIWGRMHGECRYWNLSGIMIHTSLWDHGYVKHRLIWDNTGALISEEKEGNDYTLELIQFYRPGERRKPQHE